MGLCPSCKTEISIDKLEKETKGLGFLKQEIMS